MPAQYIDSTYVGLLVKASKLGIEILCYNTSINIE